MESTAELDCLPGTEPASLESCLQFFFLVTFLGTENSLGLSFSKL